MMKKYFKFQQGTIIDYNKNTSSGTIISLNNPKEKVNFFLSDLSRINSGEINGLSVSFSQINIIKKEKWASVVVAD